MRVAVTGSSGLIGQALLAALKAAGHETVALVRRPPVRGEARWDPATGLIDRSALAGIGGAINLAGKNVGVRWSERARREIIESRISSTELLARTLTGLSPLPSVLVSMSAVGYYGDRDEE
jgi:NAD dependent epimerase/dehydratase family enzyme